MYKAVFTREARKQYDKLSEAAKPRVGRALRRLSEDPLAGKKLRGKLGGLFSLRVWPYRIIYQITRRPKTIIITTIIHRQGAYK